MVEANWDVKDVNDVIARIPGSTEADEWVVRGNHHDGWVNGAEDPISGQVALLEEARSFGELLKQGWKPKRTIIYCAWDGEEPMLLGSTAWAETHGHELQEHAAVYINSDSNDRGYLFMEGSHSLEHFMNNVARSIEDPESKLSVFERNRLVDIVDAKSDDERKELRQRADLRMNALGSGTDYTAFAAHEARGFRHSLDPARYLFPPLASYGIGPWQASSARPEARWRYTIAGPMPAGAFGTEFSDVDQRAIDLLGGA